VVLIFGGRKEMMEKTVAAGPTAVMFAESGADVINP